MRLNGWQRIGVILSVLWVVGAAITYRNEQIDNAADLFQYRYKLCLEASVPLNKCLNSVSLQDAMDETAIWSDVAFFAFGPVIAGWLLVLSAVKVYRWVSDGFSKEIL